MGGKSLAFAEQHLKHIFHNAAIPNIGDAGGLPVGLTPGDYFLRACTSAVVVNATTKGTEATFTGYVQITIPRNVSDWTIVTNTVKNAKLLTFGGINTGSQQTIRYWELWKTSGGTALADRVYWGQFASDLIVPPNVKAEVAIDAWDLTEN